MRQRPRTPSESYFWPALWAIALHVVLFAILFVSWAFAPELPPSRPIVTATLVQLKSKSQATEQTQQKLAGEAKKTAARQYEQEELEQRKTEQEAQAKAAAAKAAQADAERKAAAEAQKAQAAAEAAEAKAAADAKQAAAAKAAEEKRQADIAKKKAADEAKAKAEADAKEKAAEAAKKKAADDAKKKAAAEDARKEAAAEAAKKKAADDAKKKAAAAAAKKAAEDKKAKALAELLSDDTERQQALADETGDEVASNYDDLIIRLVSEQWRRPPSARNGMSVELQIEMLSDGTIRAVTVTRSSGDSAYDNSAVAAVKNVGRIPEMQKLDNATFQSLYAKRRMIFKPEDLSL